MIVWLRLVPAVLLLAAFVGCGHSVGPVAPYDSSAAVPPPRSVQVRSDPIGRLIVSWRATAEDRSVVDGWFVERRVTSTSTFTRLEPEAGADTVYFDDDIADGLRYVYRVLAVTGADVSSLPVETSPVRGDRTAPVVPTEVSAATATGGVLLQFQDGGEPDLAFFEVRITLPQTNLPPEFRQVAGSPALIAGLTAGNQYAFEVAAVDSAGRISPFSAPPAIAP